MAVDKGVSIRIYALRAQTHEFVCNGVVRATRRRLITLKPATVVYMIRVTTVHLCSVISQCLLGCTSWCPCACTSLHSPRVLNVLDNNALTTVRGVNYLLILLLNKQF